MLWYQLLEISWKELTEFARIAAESRNRKNRASRIQRRKMIEMGRILVLPFSIMFIDKFYNELNQNGSLIVKETGRLIYPFPALQLLYRVAGIMAAILFWSNCTTWHQNILNPVRNVTELVVWFNYTIRTSSDAADLQAGQCAASTINLSTAHFTLW